MSFTTLQGTIKFNGEQYPVRLDFGAIRRSLPLFGLKNLSEFDTMMQMLSKNEFPADAVEPFIRNVIGAGLSWEKDERPTPKIEDVERAINEYMGLFTDVVMALVPDAGKAPEESKEKKAKAKAPAKKSTTKA
ncbi:hypothetical protein [Neolewinella antarctica]|uniref:Tail assembly chaperone n=1 Tax=Neolewinella antarctica TaxID=442734 RepID=A0ABX0X726_9BACT|nr:hypothetical protein [Neolewinella antarctica]NJC24801.1 hypothetical protein [Neolewinella antarctica]